MLDHTNVLRLKHCFYSTTEKDDLYLNLVLEYVPETVYRVSKHYVRMHQHMPIINMQMYTYQYSVIYFELITFVLLLIDLANTLIDMSGFKLFASCDWSLSSGHQTPESIDALCDFGSAKMLYYRAPELIVGATEYATAIDIWCAGDEKVSSKSNFVGDVNLSSESAVAS
ncbi:Shaggy-related protein kinase theta [Glycine soja]|uniref:Shaggy-related protein kinase theta n=1 Tax=Glycine soja TaxID=3848 RepID=A0A0B2Q0K1_GLYSO|nr:Shaggy-related protein kinase theta [Glycine soja]